MRKANDYPNATKRIYVDFLVNAKREDPALARWMNRRGIVEKILEDLTVPRRANGDRASVIQHLVQRCGMCEKDAEKLIPRRATGETPRRALSTDQLRAFERAVKREVEHEPLRVALLLLPLTGCRNDEIRKAEVSNLLTEGGQMHLRVCGKGNKWRDIRLNRPAKRLLQRYLASHPPRGAFLFPAMQSDAPMTEAVLQSACRRISEETPELVGVTPHVLRHTYATQSLRNCEDLKDLRKRLGHNSLSTTLVYLHGEPLGQDV